LIIRDRVYPTLY
jgi:hypothetical protein